MSRQDLFSAPKNQTQHRERENGLSVALVSEYFYPDVGGMPEHVHELARALCKRGHRVFVVTTNFPGQHVTPKPQSEVPYEVFRLGTACPPIVLNGSVCRAAVGLSLRRDLERLFAAQGVDVVHVHAPIFPTLALLATKCAPKHAVTIGTLHTHFEDSWALRMFRAPLAQYLDSLDGLIAVSDTAADSLRRVGFRVDARVIPNGVDVAAWQTGNRNESLRTGSSFCLLAMARLEPRNRIETVVDALRIGQTEGRNARLWVLGDGPRKAELVQRARGVDVQFFGSVLAERPAFAASADAFCFTADIASFPMSLIEGMAAGLAVIAHPIPGVRELVRDGENGLLVPLCNAQAYAEALRALQENHTLRRTLGEAARQTVAPLDWSKLAAQIEAEYERARSSPRTLAPKQSA
jgi:phosphatidylinositol alpha-mannosyltransferase